MTPETRTPGTIDFRSLQIVWVAMMFGVGAYTVGVYCLLAFGVVELGIVPAAVLPIAALVAAAIMVAGSMLRRRMVDAIAREAPAAERLVKYARATVVGLALIEAGALLLVTLSLVAGAPSWALLGGGAGIGVLALSGPSREDAGLGR